MIYAINYSKIRFLILQISWMQLTMPREDRKKEIEESLYLTFPNRHKWILEGYPTIDDIGAKYPRLFDFNGYMVKPLIIILVNFLIY